MERWSGRTAIVTGANSGIGHEIAKQCLRHGMKVVGADINIDGLQALEESNCHAMKCDVTNEDEVIAVVQWAKDNYGGVDVLVNAAGLYLDNPLAEFSVERSKKVFDVNVVGMGTFIRETLKCMKEKGCDDGHIVNFCSIVGQYIPELPGRYIYCASKHAVKVLSEGLRRELRDMGTKIRVTNISPGVVRTGLYSNAQLPQEVLETMFDHYKHLTPEDVTGAVLYALGTPANVNVHEITIRPVAEIF